MNIKITTKTKRNVLNLSQYHEQLSKED